MSSPLDTRAREEVCLVYERLPVIHLSMPVSYTHLDVYKRQVEDNTFVKSLDQIPAIWTSHYWAGKVDATDTGLYRPLTLTTYNLQYALTGESPAAFHILNILLHALVCLMVMTMASLLFLDFRLVVISGSVSYTHLDVYKRQK